LLLGWAYRSAGGFGPMLSAPSRFANFADFLKFLVPALNATVGFWATVSLNIPDFTRFARSQRQQAIGQAIALPTTMTLYSLIGILVTSATVVIYGTAIWDPVQLLSHFQSPVAGIMICDYFVIRGRELQVDDLYLRGGAYEYRHGFNWNALEALAAGAGTALVGLIVPALRILYDYSWFVGFAVSFVAYYGLMKLQREPRVAAMEEGS